MLPIPHPTFSQHDQIDGQIVSHRNLVFDYTLMESSISCAGGKLMTQPSNSTFEPGEDEKLTPVMIYTAHKLIWGKALSKQLIHVSYWLMSDMAPNYMTLVDAQVLIFGAGQNTATLKIPFLNI